MCIANNHSEVLGHFRKSLATWHLRNSERHFRTLIVCKVADMPSIHVRCSVPWHAFNVSDCGRTPWKLHSEFEGEIWSTGERAVYNYSIPCLAGEKNRWSEGIWGRGRYIDTQPRGVTGESEEHSASLRGQSNHIIRIGQSRWVDTVVLGVTFSSSLNKTEKATSKILKENLFIKPSIKQVTLTLQRHRSPHTFRWRLWGSCWKPTVIVHAQRASAGVPTMML